MTPRNFVNNSELNDDWLKYLEAGYDDADITQQALDDLLASERELSPISEKGSASSGNRGHAGRPGKRGGSLPKGEHAAPIDNPKPETGGAPDPLKSEKLPTNSLEFRALTNELLKEAMRQGEISGGREYAFVLNPKGEIIHEARGGAHSIAFADDDIARFDDMTLLHCHPKNNEYDFDIARETLIRKYGQEEGEQIYTHVAALAERQLLGTASTLSSADIAMAVVSGARSIQCISTISGINDEVAYAVQILTLPEAAKNVSNESGNDAGGEVYSEIAKIFGKIAGRIGSGADSTYRVVLDDTVALFRTMLQAKGYSPDKIAEIIVEVRGLIHLVACNITDQKLKWQSGSNGWTNLLRQFSPVETNKINHLLNNYCGISLDDLMFDNYVLGSET